MSAIDKKLDELKSRISDPAFLAKTGVGNELGIFVFCYAPSEELMVQDGIRRLQSDSNAPYHIMECDLYETFLSLLSDKRILDKVPAMEENKGKDFLLKQLVNIATPEALVQKMLPLSRRVGRDVLFLTGIGKAHPFMRCHRILDQLLLLIPDIPIVLFYPGSYNGQSLSLFDKFTEGNYYRAFHIF